MLLLQLYMAEGVMAADPYQGLLVVIGVNARQCQSQQREEVGLSLGEAMDVP